MSRDHYRVLGVPPNAKQQDVRAAYLRLAKQHHPDICKASGNADHFKAINSAWEVRLAPLKYGFGGVDSP